MTRTPTTPEQDAEIVARHVAEFARLCALDPAVDCSLLAKAAEEGAENLRKRVGEKPGC